MPQRPGWLEELIGVVRPLCPAPARSPRATDAKAASWDPAEQPDRSARRVGRVTSDVALGAGWFWIGLDGRPIEDDQIEAAFLAPEEGPKDHRFQVIETRQEGSLLKVRAAEHAPAAGLYLYVPVRPRGQLYSSLLEGLTAMTRFTLAGRVADGEASPVPPAEGTAPPSWARLNEEQRAAWRACCAPGVHLVWGPPGTGKTRVIAAALQSLREAGKSVLLVSGTNIAVDNALARAVAVINPQSGEMVRAGNPHLAEIADNPAVCLQALIRSRQQVLERDCEGLSAQIAALKGDRAFSQLEESVAALEGFDPGAYQAAAARVVTGKDLAARSGELAVAVEEAKAAAADGLEAEAFLGAVTAEHQNAEPARQHLATAVAHQTELDSQRQELNRAQQTVLTYEAERDRLSAQVGGRRFGARGLKAELRENEALLQRAVARYQSLRPLVCDRTSYLQRQIEAEVAAAAPHTAETLARLDAQLRNAQEEVARITAQRQVIARKGSILRAEVQSLRALPQPTAEDRRLLAEADAARLPAVHAGLPGLRRQVTALEERIAAREAEHEKVLARMRKEGTQVRREIVARASVVAATLAMLRMRPELRDRDYDHVLVDEASFAGVPEVVFAASRAREGVTLLGDFLQNRPIAPDLYSKSKDDLVRKWYARDCFAFFGVTTAGSALAHHGCAAITEQRRFGPDITELANAVAYGGRLTAACGESRDRPEIVLVDVDGLGDQLALVRRGETGWWWPVGALLAQALAGERIREAEESGKPAANQAGVVTPYKVQVELLKDLLNESGASPHLEAGTSHRFQGREFDTVIFDFVENGKGWIARADSHAGEYQSDGVRMFTVAVTRAQRRLYLIGNAATIRGQKVGPLGALSRMIDADAIPVIPAKTILDPRHAPADPVVGELWHALRGQATVLGLADEEVLPGELIPRIDAATTSIWLWCPWAGKRAEQFLPHLKAAQARGVRVYPVILPSDEVTKHLKSRHEEVAREFPAAIYMWHMHQKIALIDDHLAFLGSMNMLGHKPGTRLEVMAQFQSRTLVADLMAHERTDQLASPPACPRCGTRVNRVRVPRRHDPLTWYCKPCGWEQPFAVRPGSRNQSRP